MNNNTFNSNEGNSTYRAVGNLNTVIDNPKMNVNDAMGVNIENADLNNDSVNQNVNSNVFNSNEDNSTYRAVGNLNTVIDNPEMNINDVRGVNIQNTGDFSSLQNNNQSEYNDLEQGYSQNTFVNNGYGLGVVNQDGMVSDNAIYEPTLKEKKKPNVVIQVSRELMTMIIIIIILLLFLLVTPFIYDVLIEYGLVISG